MIISIDVEKALNKMQKLFHNESTQQARNRRKLPQYFKIMCDSKIAFSGE